MTATTLTAARLAAMHREGFVLLPGVLDAAGIAALREAIDRLTPIGLDYQGLVDDHYTCVFNRAPFWLRFLDLPGVIELSAFDDSERVSVRVRDYGVGMASEMLDRVFDRFVQGNNLNTTSSDGLGIGLSVVKTIVDLHGGSVVARSDGPGTGCEFTVSLPVVAPAMSPAVTMQ